MNLLELIPINILPNMGDGEGGTSDLVLQKHLRSCLHQKYCHLKDVSTCLHLQQKSQKLQ